MLSHATIIALIFVRCSGYAEYELFNGFDATGPTVINSTDASNVIHTTTLGTSQITTVGKSIKEIKHTIESLHKLQYTTLSSTITKLSTAKNKPKFNCPEEESPKNIGPYEVPTQRDLVMLTKHVLLKLYYSYNQQSLQLLKDIKEATKAALALATKCNFNKKLYTQCVKNASKRCERYTKDTLMNLEAQKSDVLALTEDKICSLTDMKTDPLLLIKLLAQEKSSLHFALPGFLILLHSCNVNCSRPSFDSYKRKPLRHLTDQDLVISHFLTKKNYIQLINDSKHKV